MSFFNTVKKAQGSLKTPTLSTLLQQPALAPRIAVRGKRTKTNTAQTAQVQRLVTQLSVFSARKKQPRRLKLCMEDLIRHNVATRAWALFNKEKREQEAAQLEAQYNKIVEACEELENTDPFLAYEGTKREKGKRFTPELRVPTETPPTVVWQEAWEPAPTPEKK
ncbi:hypothetical protein D0Z00_001683 [Geotrichum galactomycetum]|uniref:Uncharacterized protein n=1 Tax=Geotrichum galactomycetum TaxID=27317 RepID=A0ACB6V6A0_9ASCO|nr:hypothetical protein D0Z00_001683 [Geotrichum candidum]